MHDFIHRPDRQTMGVPIERLDADRTYTKVSFIEAKSNEPPTDPGYPEYQIASFRADADTFLTMVSDR